MKALLIVDVQNDFCIGGGLEVPGGDKVVPFINSIRDDYPMVVLTQDWHPSNHKSFSANNPGTQEGDVILLDGMEQIMWPVHCVQGTNGAEFHSELIVKPEDQIFRKGELVEVDSYSGFLDNDKMHKTGLGEYLSENRVKELDVVGLATDYCVRFTVLDAIDFGFSTSLLRKGCRAVNLQSNDEELSISEMAQAGAIIK